MAEPPVPYRLRSPTERDLEALTELIRSAEASEWGEPESTLQDTRRHLTSVDLSSHAWLATDPNEVAAGFIFFNAVQERWWGFGVVHPEHRGRGLGTCLLARHDSGARELLRASRDLRAVELSIGAFGRDQAGRSLIERAGYKWKRRFWDMAIDLERKPEAPRWPERIEVATFSPGQARAVFDASEEAFRDHFDFRPYPFDEWKRRWLEHEGFDPTLWFLAMDGGEIAGLSLCRQRSDSGWVDVLAVRRPWRRQGLGLALLRHSFAGLYARGNRRVSLGVDSENLTGATRLYERAGMRVQHAYDTFSKELRREAEGE